MQRDAGSNHCEGFTTTTGAVFAGDKVGNTVHVSGMVALDAEGKTVGIGDCRAQTRQVLELIKAILEQAGGTLADIAHNHVCLKDLADYAAMNAIYEEYFPVNPSGTLLHPSRPGEVGVSGRDRIGRIPAAATHDGVRYESDLRAANENYGKRFMILIRSYLRKLSAIGVAAILALVASGTGAQAYPARPIRLIVPYSTGSATDSLARLIADKLTVSLGQAVVV
jgi:enamine deaminase RidA (YjgF/YER057c/UK114 family)